MTPRNTLIVAGGAFLLIVIGGALFFLTPSSEPSLSESSDSPFGTLPESETRNPGGNTGSGSSSGQGGASGSITGGTPRGTVAVKTFDGAVAVKDFTLAADVGTSTDGFLYFSYPAATASSTEENTDYTVFFYPKEGTFLITILQEPIGEVRRRMAADLADRLSVSEEDLCDLYVEVYTRPFLNPVYSAKNLGFPGCSNAVRFAGDPTF